MIFFRRQTVKLLDILQIERVHLPRIGNLLHVHNARYFVLKCVNMNLCY